jgi:hypothetical protein
MPIISLAVVEASCGQSYLPPLVRTLPTPWGVNTSHMSSWPNAAKSHHKSSLVVLAFISPDSAKFMLMLAGES